MSKIAEVIAEKKVQEAAAVLTKTAEAVTKKADEIITMNRKTFMLEIAVALLGGIVIGMFLSPRKKVSYKIASNNRINSAEDDDEEDEEEYYEDETGAGDDDEDEDDDDGRNGKFIKL